MEYKQIVAMLVGLDLPRFNWIKLSINGQDIARVKLVDNRLQVTFSDGNEKVYAATRRLQIEGVFVEKAQVKAGNSPLRPGKTAKERELGMKKQYEDNRKKRAQDNRKRAQNAGAEKKQR